MRAVMCGKLVMDCSCGSTPTVSRNQDGTFTIRCPKCGKAETGGERECRAGWNRWVSYEAAMAERERTERRNRLFYEGMSESARTQKKCNPFYGGAIAP